MPSSLPSLLEAGRTLIMGVVNVTPDSFSDGGRFLRSEDAVAQGERLVAEGADLLDVGAESSRPGSDPVDEQEELDRAAPVIEGLAGRVEVPLSIDTYKPATARACLALGALIVNDISGFGDPAMTAATAEAGAAAVIMHMRGRPKTMQSEPRYDDVVDDVKAFLTDRAAAVELGGVECVVVDPGLGFGKTAQHNFEILRRLSEFGEIGRPLLIGPSRKSFLGSLPSALGVEDRLEGTLAAVSIAAMAGARIIRVHDVRQAKRAVEVVDAVRRGALS